MMREIEQLDSIHKQLLETVRGIDAGRFERKPSEAEWSVAEVVQHLCIADNWMFEEIQKGLERPPQRLELLRQIFKLPVWMVGLRLVRVKAPKIGEPLNPPPKETLIDNYIRARGKLKDLAVRTGRNRLEQTIVVHPILGRYNGVHGISFIHYHELRHYKQIREILQKLAMR